MINSWLTLRDLEYVIAVAKHEHFGRAARECRISQPALSMQIKKVEGYLGVALFERSNRRVVTTPAGRLLACQGAIVLDEARKIPYLIGKSMASGFELLRLGVISTLAPFIPYFLPELKKSFPSSPLSLHEGQTDDLISELRAGALDAVIAADEVKRTSLSVFPIFFEPFVFAASSGHPLIKQGSLRPADLRASEMVLLEEGHCLRDQSLQVCPRSRRGSVRRFHANSIETLRHLVASGAGYTLFPLLAARGSPMGKLIGYRTFKDFQVGRKVVMICREKSSEQAPFQKLARTLVDSVPQFARNT